MMYIIYMACLFGGYVVYALTCINVAHTAIKHSLNLRILGLTVLSCIVSLLIWVELPKSFVANHHGDVSKNMTWGSEVKINDIYGILEWWSDICTRIACNCMVIILAILLIIFWVKTTQYFQKVLDVPYKKFSLHKKTWKIFIICILMCAGLLLVGWLGIVMIFVWFFKWFVLKVLGVVKVSLIR